MLDKRIGRKQTEIFDKFAAPGVRIDPGPYEAIVKNTVDPARHGRIQVYIPELGANDKGQSNNPNDPTFWRTVNYATPFYGVVDPNTGVNAQQTAKNQFGSTKQSYGMWFVPPDPGTVVLVMFVNGDPNRGFWFACVPDGTSHYMVPGLASSTNNTVVNGQAAPVVEFNDSDKTLSKNAAFLDNPHPVHTVQYQILQTQGLDKDPLRGTTTSSSQRDIPGTVFGISSPGRRYPDPALDPNFLQNLQNGNVSESDFEVAARQGGHTFIMDDGDVFGKNQMFKLRSATGHQIVMNDTGGMMYISNARGTVWIELTNVGDFNMFVQGDFNLHSNGSLNMKFDKDVRIDAGGNFQVNAVGNIQLQGSNIYGNSKTDTNFTTNGNLIFNAGGQLNLSSKSGTNVTSPGTLNFNASHIGLNDGGGVTASSAPSLKSPVSQKIPTHEPWVRAVDPNGISENSGTVSNNVSSSATNNNGQAPAQDASKAQTGKGVKKGAPLSVLQNQPLPIKNIGNLTSSQTQGLLSQIGYNESGGNYNITGGSNGNYLGKYQIGASALVDQGYITKSAFNTEGNAAVNDPNAWTGKNGIGSSSDFLNNPSIQESVMTTFTSNNYNSLLKNGGIQPGDDPGTVGGMLQVAHLLGAGGANTWRNTGSGSDAFGTTGSQYFNQGKYGVNVLGGASGSGTSSS
jgi:hypothetical protein